MQTLISDKVTALCKSHEPPYISLFFASKEPDFVVDLSNSTPGFLKGCQSFSLDTGFFCLTSFRRFIKPLNSDLGIIQAQVCPGKI